MSETAKVTNAPEYIFLAVGADSLGCDRDFRQLGEVTWSEDRQSETDLAYMRAGSSTAADRADSWIPTSKGLPLVPEGQYRVEVLTARQRDGKWVRAAAFFGSTSVGDTSRERFYIETTGRNELDELSWCVNMIEPSHWQDLPANPEDEHEH